MPNQDSIDYLLGLDGWSDASEANPVTLYVIIRSVSASGMSRNMSFYVIEDGRLVGATYHVARVLGETVRAYCGNNVIRLSRRDGDAQHLARSLAARLARVGYSVKPMVI